MLLPSLNSSRYKYLIVIIFLMVLIVYGKRFDPVNYSSDQMEYAFSATGTSNFVFKEVALRKGENYRVFLELSNNALELKNFKQASLNFMCYSRYNEKQLLKIIKVDPKSSLAEKTQVINFNAVQDCSRLALEMPQPVNNFKVNIKKVFVQQISSFYGLDNTLIGDNISKKVIFSKDTRGERYKFTRKNEEFGEVVKLNSDRISGVDVAMNFIGTGGDGNYVLELKKVDEKNGKFSVGKDRVAYYFIPYKAKANAENLVGDNVYHFPLVANINPDRNYYIGISNSAVRFNSLNTLELVGGDKGEMVKAVNGKVSQREGNLYMKVYGYDKNNLLAGEVVQDFGDGEGLYSYKFDGSNPNSYFDIAKHGKYRAFYDNVMEGISSKAKDDNNFIYRFDTRYKYNKLKVSIKSPDNSFAKPDYYISFDHKKWEKIKLCEDEILENYDAICTLDRYEYVSLKPGQVFYVKVGYDKNSVGNGLFGLKEIEISADLEMK